jgi:hypothetical protein
MPEPIEHTEDEQPGGAAQEASAAEAAPAPEPPEERVLAVLLDYGDFIFHVFEEKARRFYDLERLWRDAVRLPLPPEAASGGEAGGGSLRTGQ